MAPAKKTKTTKSPARKPAAKSSTPKKTGAQQREAFIWGIVCYAVLVTMILAIHISFNAAGGGSMRKGLSEVSEGRPFEGDAGGKGYYFDGESTWVAIPGNPVELIVLNDISCGQPCNPTQGVEALKKTITEALVVQQIDVNTSEGAALAESFGLISVPAFILGEGFSDLELAGGLKPSEQLGAILTERDGKYLMPNSSLGLKPGQYITDIPFADLDTEPVRGKGGKVRVVEFTDLQCPYCKRLGDNNKALINQLVAEGKIEYVQKDFPLNFHKEAPAMHAAVNCAYGVKGEDGFNEMRDYIFANQAGFSRIGVPAAEDKLVTQAGVLGYDTEAFKSCITSSETQAEINADIAEGRQYGVTGTPALFIGKQLIPGAIGPDRFKAAVDSQL